MLVRHKPHCHRHDRNGSAVVPSVIAVAPRKTVKTADLRGGTEETLNMSISVQCDLISSFLACHCMKGSAKIQGCPILWKTPFSMDCYNIFQCRPTYKTSSHREHYADFFYRAHIGPTLYTHGNYCCLC